MPEESTIYCLLSRLAPYRKNKYTANTYSGLKEPSSFLIAVFDYVLRILDYQEKRNPLIDVHLRFLCTSTINW
ncbi:MAG: hypothetical protein H6Q53_1619 [Deltaproteobacteria bacterium]|nr:hypothetical protein [Deltaproteobacteria bacterium]